MDKAAISHSTVGPVFTTVSAALLFACLAVAACGGSMQGGANAGSAGSGGTTTTAGSGRDGGTTGSTGPRK